MFKIKFLPARFGDCIWITYGDEEEPHHVLIDGGTAGTSSNIRRELDQLPEDRRCFDLVVITHIDRDHIEGVLNLLSQPNPGFAVSDIWFNSWPHLPGNNQLECFGAVQGERLTERILKLHLTWNKAFGRHRICVPDHGPLPRHTLEGGLSLTLLSPTKEALANLKPFWEEEVRNANLDPGFGLEVNDMQQPAAGEEVLGGEDLPDVDALAEADFEADVTPANASSIALLAEFNEGQEDEEKRVLLTGDAHPDVLRASLVRFSNGSRIPLNLFKISHHGSKYATSKELIQMVDCPTFIFSTNGSVYHHPNPEAVARVIKAGGNQPELAFNYRSSRNGIWGATYLQEKYDYRVKYPPEGEEGIEFEF